MPKVQGLAPDLSGQIRLFAKAQEAEVIGWRRRHGLEDKPSTRVAFGRCLLVGLACLVVELGIVVGLVNLL